MLIGDISDGLKEAISVIKDEALGMIKTLSDRKRNRFEVEDATHGLKPKYGGKHDIKELDEFFWSVDATSIRLSKNAALWWRRKHEDIQKGLYTIDTWEEFKKKLKMHFFPHNTKDIAVKKLHELRHIGSIRDCVAEFATLMLKFPDLLEQDKLFSFQDGL
ncbi:hypothetical protein LXL04_038038 [Taraxacum kok-saghyz]